MLTADSPKELTFIHKVVDAGKNLVAQVSRSSLNTDYFRNCHKNDCPMTLQFFLSRIFVGITKNPMNSHMAWCTQHAPHLEVVENHLKELKGWMGWIYPSQGLTDGALKIMDSKFGISIFPLGAPPFSGEGSKGCGQDPVSLVQVWYFKGYNLDAPPVT